jgi:hypothetical protein
MSSTIKALALKAISPKEVRADGTLTAPRSFGVYQLPKTTKNTRLFRFGNHPVRQHELEREFGSCKLLYLFRSRPDAVAMASAHNGRERMAVLEGLARGEQAVAEGRVASHARAKKRLARRLK